MALGGVLASALNTGASRSKGLYLDGLDIIAAPDRTYGVDPSTVSVTEAGSGQVSSLRFTLTDPAGLVTVSPGSVVRFADLVVDSPIFLGFVESYEVERLGLGNQRVITCVGIEAVLDWIYVPAFTVPTGTDLEAGLQMVATAGLGIGVALNATDPYTLFSLSTIATPLYGGLSHITTPGPCAIAAGTLRQALQAYQAFMQSIGQVNAKWAITVDFYGGLRIYYFEPAAIGIGVGDYQRITIRSDGVGPVPRPADTHYGVDMAGTPRAVYVSGPVSGLVSDGSGVVGPTSSISDANATTAAARDAIGQAYLGSRTAQVAGTVAADGLNVGAAAAQRRAANYLDLLDPQTGLPTLTSLPIVQITKTFAPSGEEHWVITFGGRVPSATQLVRRLTRDNLS